MRVQTDIKKIFGRWVEREPDYKGRPLRSATAKCTFVLSSLDMPESTTTYNQQLWLSQDSQVLNVFQWFPTLSFLTTLSFQCFSKSLPNFFLSQRKKQSLFPRWWFRAFSLFLMVPIKVDTNTYTLYPYSPQCHPTEHLPAPYFLFACFKPAR